MKNSTCKKLLIDRSKAKKVGTLKDISLFGNFTFPTEGQLVNGLQLRPLAGVGNAINKTKGQISQLSGRQIPIAGATGAVTSEEPPAAEPSQCPTPFSGPRSEEYAVRFIQRAPEEPAVSSLNNIGVDEYLAQRLETGYALKHGPGKRTLFSQAQKNILIECYNRQAINHIRAEPKDAIKAMENAGLEVLLASQIKNWWATYHRKNRNLLANALPVAAPPATVPPAVPATVPPAPPATAPPELPATVPPAVPATALPATAPPALPATVPPAEPATALPATVPPAVPATVPSSVLPGTSSSSVPLFLLLCGYLAFLVLYHNSQVL